MMLKKGNLFSTECRIIAHGVNCRAAIGSGVAGQIARLFPSAKSEYLRKFKEDGWRLGDVQFVFVEDKIIANCATQYDYGRSGVYVDYEAVASCLNKVFEFASAGSCGVAIPKIGTGLGGGDWDTINRIIQEALQERVIHLEVWEL